MKISFRLSPQRVLKHLMYWLVFFSGLVLFSGQQALNRNLFFTDLPVTLIYVYLISYLIIPWFLKKKWYLLLFLSFIVISLAFSYIRLLNYNYYYYSLFAPELQNADERINFARLILNAKDFSFGLFIFLAVKYTLGWLKFERHNMQIENKQIESEILLMKTQVDHHFLFNTLNNIYSLSVTEPSKTQFAIKKFWGILDYIVNYTDIKEIRIEKELNLISDFVELEKLRYGDRLSFELRVDRELYNFRIPPLILFPIIENCFKFGSSDDPGNPWISISLTDKADRIVFEARNSMSRNPDQNRAPKGMDETLERIRKRLDYQLKGRYSLNASACPGEYCISLELIS